jgi:hypothetical protein
MGSTQLADQTTLGPRLGSNAQIGRPPEILALTVSASAVVGEAAPPEN